jgi:hypothetical protein
MHACSLAFHICSVLFSLSEKISQNFRHTSHQSSFHSFTVTNHPSTPIIFCFFMESGSNAAWSILHLPTMCRLHKLTTHFFQFLK